jgi:hypothetical protein
MWVIKRASAEPSRNSNVEFALTETIEGIRSGVCNVSQLILLEVLKMADNEKEPVIGVEDVLPVRSRISWGAV